MSFLYLYCRHEIIIKISSYILINFLTLQFLVFWPVLVQLLSHVFSLMFCLVMFRILFRVLSYLVISYFQSRFLACLFTPRLKCLVISQLLIPRLDCLVQSCLSYLVSISLFCFAQSGLDVFYFYCICFCVQLFFLCFVMSPLSLFYTFQSTSIKFYFVNNHFI